jgi:hypothetical protein
MGAWYLTGQGLTFEASNAERGRGVVILPKLEGDLARLKLGGGRWPNGPINSARLKLHNGKLFLFAMGRTRSCWAQPDARAAARPGSRH